MVKRDKFDIAKEFLDYYKAEYKKRFGKAPVFNRIKMKYMVVDILSDISLAELKRLVEFFIVTDKYADITNFCYNYDEIIQDRNELQQDAENRRNLMRQTQRSVKEFRGRYSAE